MGPLSGGVSGIGPLYDKRESTKAHAHGDNISLLHVEDSNHFVSRNPVIVGIWFAVSFNPLPKWSGKKENCLDYFAVNHCITVREFTVL